jgi:hypothetical protein
MAAAHKALAASHFNLLTMLAPDGRVKRFRAKTVTERFLAAPSAILHISIKDASTADLLRWTVKTLAGLVAALGHFVRCHGALAAIQRVLLVVLSAWHHPIPWAGTVRDVTALGHNIRVFTYPYICNQSYSCYQDKPPGLPVGWGAVFLDAQSEVFDSAAPHLGWLAEFRRLYSLSSLSCHRRLCEPIHPTSSRQPKGRSQCPKKCVT